MNYEIIKELAKQKGLSIKKLGDEIGMSDSGLYTAFINNTLKIDTLEKIAEVLGVSPSYFFGDSFKDIIKSCIAFNASINLEKYFQNIISINVDFIGAKMFDLYNNQPEVKRKKHLDEYLSKHYIVEDEIELNDTKKYINGIELCQITRDYLLKEGHLYQSENGELSENDLISIKWTLERDFFLSEEANLIFNTSLNEYVKYIKRDKNLRFLVREQLISEFGFMKDATNAFLTAFIKINSIPDKLNQAYNFLLS
jgi:transcriptional regulator with XRE-family HTH domain